MNRATGTKLIKINTNGSPKKQNVSDLKKKTFLYVRCAGGLIEDERILKPIAKSCKML